MTWVNPFATVSLGGGGASIVVTEPVTIGATVAAPTKPTTPTIDYVTVTDDGSGLCSLQMQLSAETAMTGALPGNGIYLFRLPGGYQFDLSVHPGNTNAAATIENPVEVSRMIPGSKGFVARSGSAYMDLVAATYDATRFFIWRTYGSWEKVGSGWYQLGFGTSISYQMAFRFKKG